MRNLKGKAISNSKIKKKAKHVFTGRYEYLKWKVRNKQIHHRVLVDCEGAVLLPNGKIDFRECKHYVDYTSSKTVVKKG